jgi:hypothetical protein
MVLCANCVCFCFWLSGHWAVRLLVFFVLWGPLGLGIDAALTSGKTVPGGNMAGIVLLSLVMGVSAWLIATAPTFSIARAALRRSI